jgi:hypothetical protein
MWLLSLPLILLFVGSGRSPFVRSVMQPLDWADKATQHLLGPALIPVVWFLIGVPVVFVYSMLSWWLEQRGKASSK